MHRHKRMHWMSFGGGHSTCSIGLLGMPYKRIIQACSRLTQNAGSICDSSPPGLRRFHARKVLGGHSAAVVVPTSQSSSSFPRRTVWRCAALTGLYGSRSGVLCFLYRVEQRANSPLPMQRRPIQPMWSRTCPGRVAIWPRKGTRSFSLPCTPFPVVCCASTIFFIMILGDLPRASGPLPVPVPRAATATCPTVWRRFRLRSESVAPACQWPGHATMTRTTSGAGAHRNALALRNDAI